MAAHYNNRHVDTVHAAIAAGLPAEAAVAVEEAVKRLLYMLGSCLAGAVALSAPRVLGLLLTRLGADPQVDGLAAWVGGAAQQAMMAALGDPRVLAFKPCTVAVAALLAAGPTAGACGGCPDSLARLASLVEQSGQMGPCAAVLRAAATAAAQHPQAPPSGSAAAAGGLSAASQLPPRGEHQMMSSAPAPALDDSSDLDTDLDINNLREQLAASGMH